MSDVEIVRRLFLSFIGWMGIINIVARVVGEERKKLWFKRRTGVFTIFQYRGGLGNRWWFGRPKTKEGVFVALIMFALMGLYAYIIFSMD